uniref:Uncharacterized protein LOC105042140 isoform X3 n=1 Tax=Elaeis guineensis var. tenera TaxID=51953 RepID=A0A8N4I7Q6_ELAGV|nr:uncharacterized protein LOC105042140 isoform X3 [Elaeis guineensis]
MAEALGGRKRKRRGEAKASGLGNAESVVKTAEQRKTRSASREEVALVARPVRERKPVDRFVAGAPQPRKVGESMAFSIEQAKERAKVKEWLAKCNKERLLVLCELLNVPDAKATTKKLHGVSREKSQPNYWNFWNLRMLPEEMYLLRIEAENARGSKSLVRRHLEKHFLIQKIRCQEVAQTG